ncbi:hypothetical protein [Streptomyces sp. DSM 118878]
MLNELTPPYGSLDEPRRRLVMRDNWASRWTAAWQVNGSKVVWPIRDLGSAPVLSSKPVRGFTWRTKQRHRPGLEFLVSTGRMHGFESLEERVALLALDFMTVIEVLPQPFALSFEHVDGHAGHTPDFLAMMGALLDDALRQRSLFLLPDRSDPRRLLRPDLVPARRQ